MANEALVAKIENTEKRVRLLLSRSSCWPDSLRQQLSELAGYLHNAAAQIAGGAPAPAASDLFVNIPVFLLDEQNSPHFLRGWPRLEDIQPVYELLADLRNDIETYLNLQG